jgi:hypothetical protein
MADKTQYRVDVYDSRNSCRPNVALFDTLAEARSFTRTIVKSSTYTEYDFHGVNEIREGKAVIHWGGLLSSASSCFEEWVYSSIDGKVERVSWSN